MAKKELIITLPNPRLREKSRRVGVITPEIRKIIADMKAATLDWEASRPHEVGVALAAIQINQAYRIIAIRENFEDKSDKRFKILINPEISKLEGEINNDFEGCLSVTDIYGKVPRYSKVRIRALDENGRQIRLKAEGFLARILQHEVDHVHGLVFVDHIKDEHGAFYKLTAEGKLEPLDYETAKKTGIFR
jgi:peptide deformylase